MNERSISNKLLLTETLRLLPRFLLLVALLAIVHIVVYFAYGSSILLAVVVSTFFASAFFSAPIACSAVRAKREIRLWTRSGRKTAIFCFGWGSIVVAGFMAALQVLQGRGATTLDYLVVMGGAGLVCAATSMISGDR